MLVNIVYIIFLITIWQEAVAKFNSCFIIIIIIKMNTYSSPYGL